MATHRIPTEDTSPMLGTTGTVPIHRKLAMMPTPPFNDTMLHLPEPTRARWHRTSYPVLHLMGRPDSHQHCHEPKGEVVRDNPSREELKLPSTLGSRPITRLTNDKGWTQLLYIVTLPPQEQALCSRAFNVSPSNWINAAPYCLSFDLSICFCPDTGVFW